MGPANVVRARSFILSGYYIVMAVKTTPLIPCGTAAISFPLTMMFNSV